MEHNDYDSYWTHSSADLPKRAFFVDLLKQTPGTFGFPPYSSAHAALFYEHNAVKAALVDLESASAFAARGMPKHDSNECRTAITESQAIIQDLASSTEWKMTNAQAEQSLGRVAEWLAVAADAVAVTLSRSSHAELTKLEKLAESDSEAMLKLIKAHLSKHSERWKTLNRAVSADRSTRRAGGLAHAVRPKFYPMLIEEHAKQVFFTRQMIRAILYKLGIQPKSGEAFEAALRKGKTVAASLVKASDWIGEDEHARVSHRTARRYNI